MFEIEKDIDKIPLLTVIIDEIQLTASKLKVEESFLVSNDIINDIYEREDIISNFKKYKYQFNDKIKRKLKKLEKKKFFTKVVAAGVRVWRVKLKRVKKCVEIQK